MLLGTEPMKEWCTFCKAYVIHIQGRADDMLCFKCLTCGKITALKGETEKVLKHGSK